MKSFKLTLLSGALAIASSVALAQTAPGASTVGAGSASGSSGTVGTGGSAAAGGTSATTLGVGGTSTGSAGTSSTIGGAGSAATVDGKATTSDKVKDNPNMMQDQAKARAQDGGTFSRSTTDTKIKNDELSSRTRTMSHEPGGPPAKSTIEQAVPVQR